MNNNVSLFDKIGLSRSLLWGYLGIMIFMMGDGIEQGWLSPYLVDNGMTLEMSAMLFTVYGIAIAISSWFSGVMADTYGVRKTMSIGLLLYCIGVAGFAGLGMPTLNYPMMLLTYAFKGLGYPLFAYTFMVWIAYKTPQKKLSTAQGWFWLVFTGGLNVLGTYFASYSIGRIGEIPLLWTAIIFALVGAVFALVLNPYDQVIKKSDGQSQFKELAKGLTILKREPKVLISGIIRTINTTPQFAFPVFMPMYLMKFGFTLNDWLHIWGVMFLGNIVFNLIYGIVGDRIGWQKTIRWFGAISAAISVLLFYYSPQFTSSIYVIMFCGTLWGISLAGFVPLSALVPSLVKKDKGAAVSILNLGAGLPVFVGPAIVGLLFKAIGSTGVVWVFAGLYVIAAILTKYITPPVENLSEVELEGTNELQEIDSKEFSMGSIKNS